jgi:hypothetical protein
MFAINKDTKDILYYNAITRRLNKRIPTPVSYPLGYWNCMGSSLCFMRAAEFESLLFTKWGSRDNYEILHKEINYVCNN